MTKQLLSLSKRFNFSFYLVLGMIAIYIFCMSWLQIAQYHGLKTNMNDLGNLIQSLHNTLHGGFMLMSNIPGEDIQLVHRWGLHANFFFVLLVPVYAIFGAKGLLISQTLAVASSALILFFIGEKTFPGKPLYWSVVPFLFLIHPSVHDANLFDPHAIVFAMPVIASALYFLLQKKYRYLLICSGLLLMFKEDMGLLVASFGVYMAIQKAGNLHVLRQLFLGGTGFVVISMILMPMWQDWPAELFYGQRYGALGSSVGEIVLTSLTNPGLVISELLQFQNLIYVLGLISGFLFLPINSISLLVLTIPNLLVNLLSVNHITHQPFGYYYPAPALVVLAVTSIQGLKPIQRYTKTQQKMILRGIILGGVAYSYWFGPTPLSRFSSLKEFEVTPHHRAFLEVARQIPAEARVSAQNNLGAYLANRSFIAAFPKKVSSSDYVVLDVHDPYAVVRIFPRQRNLVYASQLQLQDYYDEVMRLFTSEDWGVQYYSQDGYIVFARGYQGDLDSPAQTMFLQRIKILAQAYQQTLIYE